MKQSLMLLLLAFALGSRIVSDTAAAPVKAFRSSVTLPTYPWWPAVPHPYFQGTDGKNIYPYPMLDNLSRERTNRTYRTVVLENDYLRITFLPELGGKIHEVIDKTTGQPMFYVNHVVKPGLIGMCGAWTSGGVEWNTGPQGHTVSAMQPIPVLILPPQDDGARSVAIGETERIYGTRWTVVVTLRPDRAFMEERVRIYNPTLTVRPYYFWNCTAAPNTPGFQFIYPMTLGCDHGSEKFFSWPIDHGKDLTRGTNYQDASSIFAWYCDQDFFGSYDHESERGVVAFANHHQVPGKKAWTWGQGGFGQMHQRDLTDSDGPYNEVQTGPLLTQGEVGRLDPAEAVEWQEWWYPVHGIGPFTFANRNLAVNASRESGRVTVLLIATATWPTVAVRLLNHGGEAVAQQACALSPRTPTELSLACAADAAAPDVEVRSGSEVLARFRVPLDLPLRTPPERKVVTDDSVALTRSGWDHLTFGRFDQAAKSFRQALEKEPALPSAHTGLALVLADRDPAAARAHAEAALAAQPDSGLARLTLAKTWLGDNDSKALEAAWQASLDPATAVAARNLIGQLLIAQKDYRGAIEALSALGPWQSDSTCRDRLAYAYLLLEDPQRAIQFARTSLADEPVDLFALAVLWLAKSAPESAQFEELISGRTEPVLELVAGFYELNQESSARQILERCYRQHVARENQAPMAAYWAAFLHCDPGSASGARGVSNDPWQSPYFPCDPASVTVLREALNRDPSDGRAALYLGHVLFHLGRSDEARQLWKEAARLGGSPAIAYRAIGMATLTLDNDPAQAAEYLAQAHRADPADAIVARDLARTLLARGDKLDDAASKKRLWLQARDSLQAAFPNGKARSDFVCLLARTLNHLEEFSETARLLDSVRITVWEGSHEAHDLFEEAHLALGKAYLKSDHPEDALVEFNRALEYPENLAIGRLEKTHDGHIHRLRAEAFVALGNAEAARQARQLADQQ